MELSDGSVFEAKVKPVRVRELAVAHLTTSIERANKQNTNDLNL
jgi:hypothetical protein